MRKDAQCLEMWYLIDNIGPFMGSAMGECIKSFLAKCNKQSNKCKVFHGLPDGSTKH